jgi:hypothetical protein
MPSFNPSDTSAAEKRCHYRIASALDSMLDMAIVMGDDRLLPAAIVDLSAGGVCLSWPPENLPVLDVGAEVELRVQSRTTRKPFRLRAEVRWLGADHAGNLRYGFAFQDLRELVGLADPVLWGLFNRRHSRR